MSRPMRWLSKVTAPFVWLLDRISALIFRLLGLDRESKNHVTAEELHLVVAEAQTAGRPRGRRAGDDLRHRPACRPAGSRSHDSADRDRLDRRRRDARRNPREPCSKRRTAGFRSPTARSRISSASSRRATCSPHRSKDEPIDLQELCRKAPVIPDLMDAMDALAVLRSADVPLALVHDEYGHLDGIVTPGSILAALAGTFAHDVEHGEEPPLVEREDGSWLVSGAASADLLGDRLGSQPAGRSRLFDGRRVCAVGAQAPAGDRRDVPHDGWKFEIVDMDGRKIDKLIASAGRRTQRPKRRPKLSARAFRTSARTRPCRCGPDSGLLDDAIPRRRPRNGPSCCPSRSDLDRGGPATCSYRESRARAAALRTSGRRP